MDSPPVIIRAEGALGHITLNRPEALNALTLPMGEAILTALGAWAADAAIESVLIDAVPGRAFCAGGDIRAIYERAKAGDPRVMEFFATEYRLNLAIAEFPKPYIALLNGVVMGGGAGISVHGSYRVATENTLFAMPETAIGFIPDVGGSYFLPRCPGGMGMYLGLTGARLGASDLLYAGLATHFVPADRLGGIAARLSAGEGAARTVASLADEPLPPPLAMHRAAIDRCFSEESVEKILLGLSAQGTWGRETAEIMERRSPTSLKLTHLLLREGASRGLRDCLAMEFALVSEILKRHDFYEGVRAILIDKDHAPKWRPERLDAVDDGELARLFPPPGTPLPASDRDSR